MANSYVSLPGTPLGWADKTNPSVDPTHAGYLG